MRKIIITKIGVFILKHLLVGKEKLHSRNRLILAKNSRRKEVLILE